MQGIVKVENNVFKTFIVKDNVEKLHSFANQPAIVHVDGSKYYYNEGNLHSFVVDGKPQPAIAYADGSKEYYKDGKKTTLDVLEQENNQSIDITSLSADKQKRVMEFIKFIEQ